MKQGKIDKNTNAVKPVRWQQTWAGWMQRQSERLSRRSKIIIWFATCIVIGYYCSSLIIGGLTADKTSKFSISPIRLPFNIGKTDKAVKTKITDQEYSKVLRYLHYLDSLKNSADGRARYDSIQLTRPGLQDSLNMVYRLYHSR